MDAWPWLALAGAGALHGLNPATGWGLAACSRDPRRALLPLALGHAAAVGGVAVLVALGGSMAAGVWLCGLLLLLALALRRAKAGLALWSGLVASVHGSGLMLVPALVPICLSASPAREITASGSLLLALAAVAVHMATMMAVTAVMALGGRAAWRRWISILGAHDPSRRSDARPQR
ncbi:MULTISPECIES: hypothetical protein [unclassified Roseateles]|uniref:hypothetical protein n=1 Tax=unclassified Roseateles TaxID=2626991 RepID=UPI0006F765DD|nr:MULTISPECIES: hypothetical protein [unclassified Roseateles]KQW46575.1 hypothetical protein ASC81_09280 [Pelomonas sp. Root405]KRA73626.1 hypothetical protein ASD88_09280 [Pelomonas sp. Root662]